MAKRTAPTDAGPPKNLSLGEKEEEDEMKTKINNSNNSNNSNNGNNGNSSDRALAKLSHTGFQAYDLSIDLVSALVGPTALIRRHSRSLADQVERASQSIPLNLREGSRRRGADGKHLYTVAAGSNDEVRAVLDVAVARGWLEETKLEHVRALLDREAAMICRLTRPRRE